MSEEEKDVGREKSHASGTREWSVASINCAKGCSHGCYYCYAREMALRFKRIEVPDQWQYERVHRKPAQERKKYNGVVMFPTTHDITPNLLQPAYEVLLNLLEAGNQVLIVSKPHLHCIQVLCQVLAQYKMAIQFRFTIGCLDGALSRTWEPVAPAPAERVAALGHAYSAGFKTSVSMEPLLDADNVVRNVERLAPWVSGSIWIGKMRKVRHRAVQQKINSMSGEVLQRGVTEDDINRLMSGQTDERIKHIYEQLRGHPLVRWKESIKKVVGLPLETEAGKDR